jgi:hypothetical protein
VWEVWYFEWKIGCEKKDWKIAKSFEKFRKVKWLYNDHLQKVLLKDNLNWFITFNYENKFAWFLLIWRFSYIFILIGEIFIFLSLDG